MPFFTVAMPIYNAEEYLDQSIKSVMEQSEKDFELILVDDGSKDNSVKVCEEWKSRYHGKIKLIVKENTGSLFTRRICLKAATGKYIYIMDADDYLVDNDALKKIRKCIDETKSDLIFFNATASEDKKTYFPYEFHDRQIFEGDTLNLIYKLICKGDTFNALWNKVYSSELVDLNEDYSKYSSVTNATDMFQMLPIAFNAKKITYCKEIFYFYRFDGNSNSIVHKFRPTIHESLRENFLRLVTMLESNNIKIERSDEILANRYMNFISTSIYKTRLIKNDMSYALEYIRNIGEEDLFRKEYKKAKLEDIEIFRRIIVWMAYHRKYWILCKLISWKK